MSRAKLVTLCRHAWQSKMRKVTWRRFNQSAKQLVVGQTTISYITTNSNSQQIIEKLTKSRNHTATHKIWWLQLSTTNNRSPLKYQQQSLSSRLTLSNGFKVWLTMTPLCFTWKNGHKNRGGGSSGFGRRCWSSPQWCYQHHLHSFTSDDNKVSKPKADSRLVRMPPPHLVMHLCTQVYMHTQIDGQPENLVSPVPSMQGWRHNKHKQL